MNFIKLCISWAVLSRRNERGLSLIESLVAITILAVLGLSITYNTIYSYRITLRNIRYSVAAQLALERIEQLAARDPIGISSDNNENESLMRNGNMEFVRTTVVTINADNSRTVRVDVVAADESLGGRSSLSNTFALWGPH